MKYQLPQRNLASVDSAHRAPSLPSQFPQTIFITSRKHIYGQWWAVSPRAVHLYHGHCPHIAVLPTTPYTCLLNGLPIFLSPNAPQNQLVHIHTFSSIQGTAAVRPWGNGTVKNSGFGIRRAWSKTQPCFCLSRSKLISELQVSQLKTSGFPEGFVVRIKCNHVLKALSRKLGMK